MKELNESVYNKMLEALTAPDDDGITITEMIKRAEAARTKDNAKDTDDFIEYLQDKAKQNEQIHKDFERLAATYKTEKEAEAERKAVKKFFAKFNCTGFKL